MPDPATAAAWLAEVRAHEGRGELILAYDIAQRGLEVYPDDLWLRYRAVLALAKSGATRRARTSFLDYGLKDHPETDIAALGARIAKDVALAAPPAQRPGLFAAAADDYESVFRRDNHYFPGINVATLRLLSGNRAAAAEIAEDVLRLCAATADDPYYVAATEAEALLVLNREADARQALTKAGRLTDDLAARATTRRQLRLICAIHDIDETVLAPLAPPTTIHFAGHRIAAPGEAGRFTDADVERVAGEISGLLDTHSVGFGYGALASGADILFAEALLARKAELHVVLPFDVDEFAEVSVATSGPAWVNRFRACLDRATTVSMATTDSYLGDDNLFTYGSQIAMGLAVLRAHFIDGAVRQMVFWDGAAAAGLAGTGLDVAVWRAAGRETDVIACRPAEGSGGSDANPAPKARALRSMLFGDIKGFSKLREAQLGPFVDQVLGALGRVVAGFGSSVLYANTWGDGLFAVFDEPAAAARCALDLQAAMDALDLPSAGLPETLALRLGGHFGPVIGMDDPIQKRPNFFGAHVSRTARIEPVTPPGEVFVTEAFAARLALEQAAFNCDYVGIMPAAKDYGDLRMYHLHAR